MPPEQILPQNLYFREIRLSNGMFALVDVEDYESLSPFKWQAALKGNGNYYAVRHATIDGADYKSYMHREILGLKRGDKRIGDHINPPLTLDNRRHNLRIATPSQSRANRRVQSNSKSGIKGVSFAAHMKMWTAHICFEGKQTVLGFFETKEEARTAYRTAAVKHHGEFARLA